MNSGAIIALATVTLASITGYYAWITKKILKQNQQIRIDAQKPEIAIYLHPAIHLSVSYPTHAHFYVENIGAGPTYKDFMDFDQLLGNCEQGPD